MMIIPSFLKNLYKMFGQRGVFPSLCAFVILLMMGTPLVAYSPQQELKSCKTALLAQLNGKKRTNASGCPISQKLVLWLGISRKPEQFTPKELIRFLDAHSHWPFYGKLCEKSEDVIKKKGTPKEILAWFAKHPPTTPGAVIVYANTLLAHKQKKKADAVIVKAWQSMEMTKTEEKKFLAQFKSSLSAKHHTARLNFLLWEGNVESAKRLLVRVPAEVKKKANLRIALLAGKAPQHGVTFKEEGILYETLKWHKKQKDWVTAAPILIQTSTSKAYAEKWWKLRSYVAREFIALQDYKKAYSILKKHNLEPGTEHFGEAEWLLGWLSLRFLNNPAVAQRHFETFGKNVKAALSKARAFYWLGRTHEAKADLALAKKWYTKAAQYKTTYYGQLGAIKVGAKPYPILHNAPKATAEEKKRFNQKDLVVAAHILKGLGKGATHELIKFLSPIGSQAKTKAERELAVQLAHTLSPSDVVWVAKRAGNREPVLLKAAYPICSLPKKKGLPESALLLAIAYQESLFNPSAQSSKGAIGLLQLMPATAARTAKQLGIPHTHTKLFDPRHNLLLGSSHLASLLNDFNKSYLIAAAAYNAGSTPIDRWLQDLGSPHGGKLDVVDWIELIPYAETRNYVMRILENTTNYRSRLQGTPTRTLSHDLQNRR